MPCNEDIKERKNRKSEWKGLPCNEERERKGKIEDPSGRDFSAKKKQGEVVPCNEDKGKEKYKIRVEGIVHALYCRSFGGNFKVCTKPIEVIDEAFCLRPKKMCLEGSGRFGKACGKEP